MCNRIELLGNRLKQVLKYNMRWESETAHRERQLALVEATVAKLPAGAEIVAAFDADDAGRKLVDVIRQAVASVARRVGRSDLAFQAQLPAKGEKDWNQVLQDARRMVG